MRYGGARLERVLIARRTLLLYQIDWAEGPHECTPNTLKVSRSAHAIVNTGLLITLVCCLSVCSAVRLYLRDRTMLPHHKTTTSDPASPDMQLSVGRFVEKVHGAIQIHVRCRSTHADAIVGAIKPFKVTIAI